MSWAHMTAAGALLIALFAQSWALYGLARAELELSFDGIVLAMVWTVVLVLTVVVTLRGV